MAEVNVNNDYSSKIVKFSVIIPMYNVEVYLCEALNSIVNQSLKEIEIILIDDGSTDNTNAIAKSYAERDSRIRLICQENQGQGVARNKGVEMATGEYICFVDPDDYIELNALELLYDKFVETGVEVIHFDFYNLNDKTKKIRLYNFYEHVNKNCIFNLRIMPYYCWQDFRKNCFLNIRLEVWNKAYSTKFMKENNVFCALNKHGEDHILSLKAFFNTDRTFYFEKPLYYYRYRVGSAVNRLSDDNFCVFDNMEQIKQFLHEKSLLEVLNDEYNEYRVNILAFHYCMVMKESRKRYREMCEDLLSVKDYKRFVKTAKSNCSFFENIFSLKNQRRNGEKVKLLTILGIKIVIKK
ncbi:MAG: glycosyltransferase [Candidatus Gastranaerophilales bacterium]